MVLVGLGSVLWSGCASPEETGSAGARVTSWLAAAGGSAIGQVSVDSRNVSYVLDHHNTSSAVRSACAVLTTDAQTGIGNLPTPDGSLTTELNNAYEDAAAAGTDCYDGIGKNSSLMAKSARERGELPGFLSTAVARIEVLTGHVPSTSTTAPTNAGGDPFGGG